MQKVATWNYCYTQRQLLLHTTAASVKIVGTLNCLLTLPMLVKKIWWVNCDKQHWEDEGTGQKWKKKHYSLEVSQLFLSETEAMISILNVLLQHYAVKNIFVITLFYVTVDQMNRSGTKKGNIIFHSVQTQNIYFYLKNGLFSCRIKVILCPPWLLINSSFHL